MASSAPATNNSLESLPPRPPTPPRETHTERGVSLRKVLGLSPLDVRLSLQTPPGANSPLSTGATNSNSASKRAGKKVEWSNRTEYKDPPEYRDGFNPNKSSPFSARSTSRPIKGILKPSPSPNPLTCSLNGLLDGLEGQTNLAEMLESTIKQLAGTDRDSRLDSYMMLSRALKASNNLPDRVALQDKMSLFMQFIQRDLFAKQENGSPDTSLINHALTLLTTFLHFQAIASTLTSDFGIFIIDHCIRSFDDPTVPKDVIRHLMQVVAFQSFSSSKVMTVDRVGRLVGALHRIENHLTGKSIVMSRIHIYKRLIKQSRGHMATHTDWLKDMLSDMLSSIKEIRAQAIGLCSDAGFAQRNEKQLMQKVTNIWQTTDGGRTYIEFYMQQLKEMIKDKQSSAAVPQIWGSVILLLRGPLEKWQHFSSWLKIVQFAFNTADVQTKHEANYAWNRYVYLSLMDGTLSAKGLTLLGQPLISQLRRKFNSKQVDEGMKLRRVVMGGICNLLYYVFRPGHDKASPDTLWEFVLLPIVNQLVSLDGKLEGYGDSMTQASRILAGLLDVSTPRGWKEDRIRDPTPVAPDELPPLDPKWVRKNSDKIFPIIGPILEKKFGDLANTESQAYRLWKSLVVSVSAAASKDIKVADDTVKFLACAFGFLRQVWSKGAGDDKPLSPKFYSSVQNFASVLYGGLGLLPFTEKRLSMSAANVFEPVATLSHRPDRPDSIRGLVQAPVHHLFSMLSSIPPGGEDDEDFNTFFQTLFQPFLNERSTKIRVDLSREMIQLLPRNALSPYGPWVLVVSNMRLPLEEVTSSLPSSSDRLLGPDYREVISLLERGLLCHPKLPSEHWLSLFNTLSEHTVRECGDAGRALGLIEPLAKVLLDNFFNDSDTQNNLALAAATKLFQVAKLPRDRQAVESARRRLWGAPPTTSRATTFDPFDYLYKLENSCLKFYYNTLGSSTQHSEVASFLGAITLFLADSFPQAGIKSLQRLQDGIYPWIHDNEAQIKLSDDAPISNSVRALWDTICHHLTSLGRLDNKDLNQLEQLLSAGFQSKHRYTVNKMAETWNATFKNEDSLDCSDSLKAILTSLQPRVDVALPGIESSGEFGAQAPDFIDSQGDISLITLSSSKSSRHDVERNTPSPASATSLRGPMTRKRLRESTPDLSLIKPLKRTRSTPRLRHDNSQIQFAPIANPSPLADESQHLTERQKEVRERQREHAGLHSGFRSSPRIRSRTEKAKQPELSTPSAKTKKKEVTPEPPASYGDYISLTPTPRRGQALQIEDLNDPPSSPPEPRPNPLLKEIQTRSRSRTSLEPWEFSSPPGSPPASQSQQAEESQPVQHSATKRSRSRRGRPGKSQTDVDVEVVPSSIAEYAASDGHGVVSTNNLETFDPPASNDGQMEDATPAEAVPATAEIDDNLVAEGGEAEVGGNTKEPQLPPAQIQPSADDGDSFAFNEADESSMMRFVIELESRPCKKAMDYYVSPEKKECITVSSPGEKLTRSKSAAAQAAAAAAAEVEAEAEAEAEIDEVEENSHSQGKRKRRRSGKTFESRRKKRRSVEMAVSDQPKEDGPALPQTPTSPGPATRRSSRRNAGQRSSKHKEPEPSKTPEKDQSPHKAKPGSGPASSEEGDTDEEVTSQLVTESRAASESQSQEKDDIRDDDSNMEDAMDLAKAAEPEFRVDPEVEGSNTVEGEEAEKASNKTKSIVKFLHGGLDELRTASLTRDEVYLLEDLLMDLKRELFEAERRGRH